MSVARDFVSKENRPYKLKIGQLLASSLSGFVAGVLAASIIWIAGIWFFNTILHLAAPYPSQVFYPEKAATGAASARH